MMLLEPDNGRYGPGWRELCLQALYELEPERRLALLERMQGVLRRCLR